MKITTIQLTSTLYKTLIVLPDGLSATGISTSVHESREIAFYELSERKGMRQMNQTYSNGFAYHTDKNESIKAALLEVIERDAIINSLATEANCLSIGSGDGRFLYQIPTDYPNVHVVACEFIHGDFRAIYGRAGLGKNPTEETIKKALQESFIRPTLDERFRSNRMPKFKEGPLMHSNRTTPFEMEVTIQKLEYGWLAHVDIPEFTTPKRYNHNRREIFAAQFSHKSYDPNPFTGEESNVLWML